MSNYIPEITKSCSGEVIRSGGGIVLVEFENADKAQEFLRKSRASYWKHGISATFLPYSPKSAASDFYTNLLKPIFLGMKALKDMPKSTAFHYSTIHSVPCENSGLYPAERVVQVPDGVRRIGYADNRKKLSFKKISKIEKDLCNSFGLKIPKHFGGIVSWSEDEEPKEKDIPGTSEERLLGIVYADVNALGRLTPLIGKDKNTYRNFCGALRKALEEAIYEALGKILDEPVKGQKPSGANGLPVRVLYVGGDDLAVAIKGLYAVDFVAEFIELFEDKTKSLMANLKLADAPDSLTISVGLVIAPYNYPIHNFNLIGKELVERAKRVGKREKSLVDICMIKNNAVGGLKEIRIGKKVNDNFLLYGGPYTTEKLKQLKAAALDLDLAAFPRHKLHELAELLYFPNQQATFEFVRWFSSLNKYRERFINVCDRLSLGPFPVPREKWEGIYRTSIIDLIELYDLLVRG
ncbi:Cas10/Cmr2 second palm domain-containing protein [Candidatus Hakubella thermalkaliphila]|uniref:Cas10/Cmr2 second palm domain-containing protein n=1 Tax=Candidatus Hakubella thermalkaliphila TaxID=2754717 RepID=UPI0015936C84|nr:hypothetical protein [Candidatus Hakubella thermalkaliphila]